ncbi:hypothetical protein AGOR_G00194030 [Albula goreensis]|uniref:Uncharacterized protein n=1 Tax=Albula goreensis TaxID=1534307 RepID=A0A8T3CWV0_9TELE|nr:hypothetical protein AGOR_G00194030 [Albula goreensis]
MSPCPSPIPPSRKKRGGISATLPERTSRSRLRQEVLVLTEEVKAQKELVKLLQQALAEAQQEKLASSHFLAMSEEEEEDGAEPAHRHCERQVAELSALVEAERGQREALERALAQRDAQVMELQEHARMMMEKNQAKQEVVLRLSQQLAACMDDPHRTVPNSMGDATFSQLQEEIHNLKSSNGGGKLEEYRAACSHTLAPPSPQDDIEAYKIQNKFLNSEIYQLTRLWRKSSEQEKSLMMKCAYLESRNCQTQGRYLGVLRNLQDSKQLDAGQQEVVKSLIQDSVDRDAKDVLKLDPIREYDEYGFKIVPDFEVEDVKLLAKIQALEVRTHNLLRRDQGEGVEGGVSARWARYLSGRPPGGELRLPS